MTSEITPGALCSAIRAKNEEKDAHKMGLLENFDVFARPGWMRELKWKMPKRENTLPGHVETFFSSFLWKKKGKDVNLVLLFMTRRFVYRRALTVRQRANNRVPFLLPFHSLLDLMFAHFARFKMLHVFFAFASFFFRIFTFRSLFVRNSEPIRQDFCHSEKCAENCHLIFTLLSQIESFAFVN